MVGFKTIFMLRSAFDLCYVYRVDKRLSPRNESTEAAVSSDCCSYDSSRWLPTQQVGEIRPGKIYGHTGYQSLLQVSGYGR